MNENVSDNNLTNVPHSYWMASTPQTDYPKLNADLRFDTAIIGGGMAGILTAYFLKKEGQKVAIIEADRILQGTTGHTTAKITSQHGLMYSHIKKAMGVEMSKQYADANETAIRTIESLAHEYNIDCDFESQSSYVYTQSDSYVQKIIDEAKTAVELGIKAEYTDKLPLPIDIKAAVRFDNQAQYHPRKFLLAIAEQISGSGCDIFEKTRVIDIMPGTHCTVVTEHGNKITADNVVLASHFPFFDGGGLYFTRLYPERSYALGVAIEEKYPGGMYITAEDPGRSFRSQKFDGGEMVIVGGEHHKTGQGGPMLDHYFNLKKSAMETFHLKDIPYHWSTQDYTTADEIPYAGQLVSNISNVYVATGFGKWGMTNSTVSAMLIKDLIVKRQNPWQDVYDPSRFTPAASIKNFIKENSNVAKQLITGKLKPMPGDIDVKNGEAKVLEIDGGKTGAYRDEKGVLHLVDTTCTHMGCELQWNDAEKTWDCPCHGSRFTYEGDIVEGPALKSIRVDLREQGKE